MSFQKKQKYCTDYKNNKGCGAQLKWANYIPLVQVGEFPGGNPKFQGRYVNMDGTEHDHENVGKILNRAPVSAPRQEVEEAQVQAAGFKEAKMNSYIHDEVMPAILKAIGEIKDDFLSKTSSNNVTLIEHGKLLIEIRDQNNHVIDLVEPLVKKQLIKTGTQLYEESNVLPDAELEEEVVDGDGSTIEAV